jgi:diacylglycerol kinase family enzyme
MSTDGAGPTKVDFGLSPVTALSIGTMRGKNMSASFDAALYPFAHFADGALDVVAAGDISDLEFFRRTFCIIFRGRRDDGPEAEYVKATEVHMESVSLLLSSHDCIDVHCPHVAL